MQQNWEYQWRYSIAARKIFTSSQKICVHHRRQYDKKIDGNLLISFINHKYIVKVRPFVTANTDDMYNHIKPTQRNFQPNVYISHIGTNNLPIEMTPEEISEKIITFSKHLKIKDNEVVVSGIVPRADSYKEKAEVVNKVLKDTCTKENMHFICHSNINIK